MGNRTSEGINYLNTATQEINWLSIEIDNYKNALIDCLEVELKADDNDINYYIYIISDCQKSPV